MIVNHEADESSQPAQYELEEPTKRLLEIAQSLAKKYKIK